MDESIWVMVMSRAPSSLSNVPPAESASPLFIENTAVGTAGFVILIIWMPSSSKMQLGRMLMNQL